MADDYVNNVFDFSKQKHIYPAFLSGDYNKFIKELTSNTLNTSDHESIISSHLMACLLGSKKIFVQTNVLRRCISLVPETQNLPFAERMMLAELCFSARIDEDQRIFMISSMPKSGSTTMEELIQHMLETPNPINRNGLNNNNWAFFDIFSTIMNIKRKNNKYSLIKNHFICCHDLRCFLFLFKPFCIIQVRNIENCLKSLSNHYSRKDKYQI